MLISAIKLAIKKQVVEEEETEKKSKDGITLCVYITIEAQITRWI